MLTEKYEFFEKFSEIENQHTLLQYFDTNDSQSQKKFRFSETKKKRRKKSCRDEFLLRASALQCT